MHDQSASAKALPLRLKEFRKEKRLSVQQLADRIDVPAYTVRRWETGTSSPSRDVADRLADAGLGTIEDEDTNLGSRSRTSSRSAKGMSANVLEADLGLHELPGGTAPPWVTNGPSDQHEFQRKLIDLQLDGGMKTSPHRLSMVAQYAPGRRTSQTLLEAPRPTSASWNSNYGSHGWHRYVGRFPPHVIRALLNHFGANERSVVCDPFSGSGTTAVECRLLGISCVGVEIGALSHLMATVKAAFRPDPDELIQLAKRYTSFIEKHARAFKERHGGEFSIEDVLSRNGNAVPRFSNIEKWFTAEAFLGVSLTVEFAREQPSASKDAVLIALSAKMRSIGNVDVDVVRAEYSKRPRTNVDVGKLVAARLRKMSSDIAAMLRTHPDLGQSSSIRLIEGSALSVHLDEASVDFVITSPPYGVEALSYLRTHLLSYRALASELDHDPYDTRDQTIGSEYLGESELTNEPEIAKVSATFRRFFDSVESDPADKKMRQRRVGMMKFFEDMHTMGQRMATWLKDEGRVAFVIGNKRLGDKIIPTDEIIIETFASSGLHLYDRLHHKLKTNNSNSQVPWQERIIQEEAILLFRRTPRS